jgi:hypothetical protein
MVQPGIIDAATAQRIRGIESSVYPNAAFIAAMFNANLTNARVPPGLVAQKILEIAQRIAGSCDTRWALTIPSHCPLS